MTDLPIDPATNLDPHADKYNDPRARITKRGIWLGIAVAMFGIIGAAASIYGRRTRLGETTRFWGQETITALQLGEKIELIAKRGVEFPMVELSGTPGLGHLRRALLDERTYDWQTESAATVLSKSSENVDEFCVTLRVTDPTAHRVGTVDIDIDITSGWVGPSDEAHCVQVAARKRSGLRNFLSTIMHKERQRYDMRDSE